VLYGISAPLEAGPHLVNLARKNTATSSVGPPNAFSVGTAGAIEVIELGG
jgi:hypothetical protein